MVTVVLPNTVLPPALPRESVDAGPDGGAALPAAVRVWLVRCRIRVQYRAERGDGTETDGEMTEMALITRCTPEGVPPALARALERHALAAIYELCGAQAEASPDTVSEGSQELDPSRWAREGWGAEQLAVLPESRPVAMNLGSRRADDGANVDADGLTEAVTECVDDEEDDDDDLKRRRSSAGLPQASIPVAELDQDLVRHVVLAKLARRESPEDSNPIDLTSLTVISATAHRAIPLSYPVALARGVDGEVEDVICLLKGQSMRALCRLRDAKAATASLAGRGPLHHHHHDPTAAGGVDNAEGGQPERRGGARRRAGAGHHQEPSLWRPAVVMVMLAVVALLLFSKSKRERSINEL